jgi:hypothetical protein
MTERSWRILVYFDFIIYLARIRPDFSPPMRGIDAPVGATVVATVHTGLEIGTAKALAEKGRKVSVIRWFNARNSPRRAAFKLPESIEAIEADANSLIHARRSLAEGRTLLADCDYPLPDNPRSAESVRVISNAIFELAKRSGAKLCFVLPYIDKHGLITFKSETVPLPLRPGVEYRKLFVDFLTRSGMNWISWRF